MGRGLAGRPAACAVHPHRSAVDRCDDCLGPFCGECLVRGGARLRCRGCWGAAPAQAAATSRRRHPLYRLRVAVREHRASAVAGALITAVLLLLLASSAAGLLSPQGRAAMAEPVERAAVARGAGGALGAALDRGAGDPRPPPPPPAGNALVGPVSADDGSESGRFTVGSLLQDGWPDGTGWRSRTDALPVTLQFGLRQPAVLDRVAFRQTQASPPPSWAGEVEVLLSLVRGAPGDDAGWTPVGRWALGQTPAPQEFAFRPTLATAVRVRVLARHGDAFFTSLGALALGRQVLDLSPLLAG